MINLPLYLVVYLLRHDMLKHIGGTSYRFNYDPTGSCIELPDGEYKLVSTILEQWATNSQSILSNDLVSGVKLTMLGLDDDDISYAIVNIDHINLPMKPVMTEDLIAQYQAMQASSGLPIVLAIIGLALVIWFAIQMFGGFNGRV